MTQTASVNRVRAVLVALLAWVLPGAGHVFLGRRNRGLLYFVLVVASFLIGILLEGRFFVVDGHSPLTILAVFTHWGTGLPYLLIRWSDAAAGNVLAPTSEHGTAFLLTAGLMNLLLVLDAHDIAVGRKP